jgi:hypothetical protein
MPNEDVDAVANVLNTMVDNIAKGSVPDQITVALVDEVIQDNERKAVEIGLQRFNAINANNHVVCETIVNAIQAKGRPSDSIKMYCNPTIGLLSDFAPHYKMLISVNGAGAGADSTEIETIISNIESTFSELLTRPIFPELDVRVTPAAPFMGANFKQVSLVLWIGKVFRVPVFTAYVVGNAFDNAVLESNLKPIVDEPFQHNAKLIANYNRVDVLLELLLHSEDIYAPVNVLVARGIHALIVSKFAELSSPNVAIAEGCQPFFDMVRLPGLKSVIAKMTLIAVLQDPNVRTVQGEHFSDIFPSGQYGKYFGEVAHRAATRLDDQGPIMIAYPLTRTDIIVAAITAMNAAMMNKGEGAGETPHMVISGGAGVSYYIQDFLTKLEADPDAFQGSAGMGMGIDIDMAQLKRDCMKIKMNDIDCIVFGDVSRLFLSVFSLYMMVLYDNFFARPKRYGVAIKDAPPISFALSPNGASDRIDMYMYGNRDDDSNTMLISKRLRKDPKVQLVTQKTKCFSQIVHPLCERLQQEQPSCKEDEYYLEPIDLVKKTMEHFANLYMRSLYPKQAADTAIMEKIATMLKEGYSGNLVSLKVMMLDIICIFCDEGASLFCRIFMARKNPKDFARLRVFIDIYLLQLMRSNPSLAQDNAAFIADVRKLRDIMARLNTDYYLEQGSIAAFDAEKAEQLNARRDEFLGLLREVGRAIVNLDAPTEPVPTQFQEATGESTIQFFKGNSQIKYKFDMGQHMDQLFGVYTGEAVEAGKAGSYDAWLNSVFETILVTPKVEALFREKLATILGMDAESNYEISFKDMPTRSPDMLELLNALKGIKMDEATLKQMNKFGALRSNLLGPLREFIAKQGGVPPSATYVINLYDKSTINNFLIALVKYALLNNILKSQSANSGLMKIANEPANYDDAVREEIGRILLEWNEHAPVKLGGSTRKRKRVCRLKNARTRRQSNTRLMSKKRSTRNKRKASNPRCKRTHRKYIV